MHSANNKKYLELQIQKLQEDQVIRLKDFELQLVRDVCEVLTAEFESVEYSSVDLSAGVISFKPLKCKSSESEYNLVLVFLPRINIMNTVEHGSAFNRTQIEEMILLDENSSANMIGIAEASLVGGIVNNLDRIIGENIDLDARRSQSHAIISTARRSVRTMLNFLSPILRKLTKKDLLIYTIRNFSEAKGILKQAIK